MTCNCQLSNQSLGNYYITSEQCWLVKELFVEVLYTRKWTSHSAASGEPLKTSDLEMLTSAVFIFLKSVLKEFAFTK